jgi:hypothetical protein
MYNEVMDSVQITARVQPGLVERIDKFAAEHRWSRAIAIQVLIERGLSADQQEEQQ